jgi:hypothetical protein
LDADQLADLQQADRRRYRLDEFVICVLLVAAEAHAAILEITSGSITSSGLLNDSFFRFRGPGFSVQGANFDPQTFTVNPPPPTLTRLSQWSSGGELENLPPTIRIFRRLFENVIRDARIGSGSRENRLRRDRGKTSGRACAGSAASTSPFVRLAAAGR